jgi:hypothetical protein
MGDLVGVAVPLAVDLHREPGFRAVEIQDVGADRVLPTESQSGQLSAARV